MIYKYKAQLRRPFCAPKDITIGYQDGIGFVYWARDGAPDEAAYRIVATGEDDEGDIKIKRLIQSITVAEFGEVYHLVEVEAMV